MVTLPHPGSRLDDLDWGGCGFRWIRIVLSQRRCKAAGRVWNNPSGCWKRSYNRCDRLGYCRFQLISLAVVPKQLAGIQPGHSKHLYLSCAQTSIYLPSPDFCMHRSKNAPADAKKGPADPKRNNDTSDKKDKLSRQVINESWMLQDCRRAEFGLVGRCCRWREEEPCATASIFSVVGKHSSKPSTAYWETICIKKRARERAVGNTTWNRSVWRRRRCRSQVVMKLPSKF